MQHFPIATTDRSLMTSPGLNPLEQRPNLSSSMRYGLFEAESAKQGVVFRRQEQSAMDKERVTARYVALRGLPCSAQAQLTPSKAHRSSDISSI